MYAESRRRIHVGKRAEESVIIHSNILERICFSDQFNTLNNFICFRKSKSYCDEESYLVKSSLLFLSPAKTISIGL